MEVTARINIDGPTGRKLVREIQKHKKVAELEYPHPSTYSDFTNHVTVDEAFDRLMDKLNVHYGTSVMLV